MVKKEDQYRTVFGSAFSIGIYFFTAYSFIGMMIEVLSYANPNVISKASFNPNPEVPEIVIYTLVVHPNS
jgi:hypothetical protein